MNTECEVKFYPVDKEDARRKLRANRAALTHPERKLTIRVYNHRTNPQINGDYIRLRDEGDQIRLSVKIHALDGGNVTDQKELDVTVSDFEAMTDILERAGLKRSGNQVKLRETWKLHDTEVVIDTWPGLEPMVEIEGKDEQSVAQAAALLGFDWSNKIITSVVEIYMAKYSLSLEQVLKLLEHATLDDDPFTKLN